MWYWIGYIVSFLLGIIAYHNNFSTSSYEGADYSNKNGETGVKYVLLFFISFFTWVGALCFLFLIIEKLIDKLIVNGKH